DTYSAIDLGHQLYVAAGSGLPTLVNALRVTTNQPGNEAENESSSSLDIGPRRVTSVQDVHTMPNRWFGYEAVDLLILPTGNRDYLTALLGEGESRKEDLRE